MLSQEEYNKLLHDLADIARTIKKMKLDMSELINELDATAYDIEKLKEKIQ